MDSEELKKKANKAIKQVEGLTYEEVTQLAKKHSYEVILCLIFLVAFVFSYLTLGQGWDVFAASLGAIIGVIAPKMFLKLSSDVTNYLSSRDKTTRLVYGVIAVILAGFLHPLAYLVLGLYGGKSLHLQAMVASSHQKSDNSSID